MAYRWGLLLCCGLISTTLAFTKEYVAEVRQNFAEKSNSDLNNQMAAFQRASFAYMAYASYFDRASVNLPGFRKFFLATSQAALKDSQKVIDYINMRGGHQQFPLLDMSTACKSMKVPADLQDQFPANYKPQPEQSSQEDWQKGLMALTDALLLERSLNSQLIDLIKGATQRKDKHLRHMVEDSFLTQQIDRIKKLADVITKLRLYSEQDYPLGEYTIDLEMGN